jgi:phosphohistidine swiveling domain-containing protein
MAFKERENGMNTSSRKNLFILSFTLLVVMLGYSMAMPLLPFYIENFGVGGTELGGPLSHSSIVAREYGIPAVLATGVATRRVRDGQMITVDGGAGIVSLN